MAKKLSELEATFIGNFSFIDGVARWKEIPSVDGAQGITFICPLCENETIFIPFANPRNATVIPQEAWPTITYRWTLSGETLESLNITPSIDLSKNPGRGCKWHGWVKNGAAE